MPLLIFIASAIGAILSLKGIISDRAAFFIKLVYFFCFIFTAGVGVWNAANVTLTIKEHCSVSAGNVSFQSGGNNILIRPKYKIVEVIGLKIRDSWSGLQLDEDFEILPNNVIKIKWIFGDNQIDNEALGQRGFALSYKAGFTFFDLNYWKLFFKKRS
jgi:hypothetical protein